MKEAGIDHSSNDCVAQDSHFPPCNSQHIAGPIFAFHFERVTCGGYELAGSLVGRVGCAFQSLAPDRRQSAVMRLKAMTRRQHNVLPTRMEGTGLVESCVGLGRFNISCMCMCVNKFETSCMSCGAELRVDDCSCSMHPLSCIAQESLHLALHPSTFRKRWRPIEQLARNVGHL